MPPTKLDERSRDFDDYLSGGLMTKDIRWQFAKALANADDRGELPSWVLQHVDYSKELDDGL